MTPKICDIKLRETNRTEKRVYEAYNSRRVKKFPNCSEQRLQKTLDPFTKTVLGEFCGISIAAYIHRKTEYLDDM